MYKTLSVIVLALFSHKAHACVMPEFVGFGEVGAVVIFTCCLIAVLLRARTNRSRIWVPIIASLMVSSMLLPFFYILTPDYFYDSCGSGARETAIAILACMIMIPIYEFAILIKQKFNQAQKNDVKISAS